MRVIATVLSCAALLSCSTDSDNPRSPTLSDMVRAPDVVWSVDTFACQEIVTEDNRLEALSKAKEIERHKLVRERNIQLVQWVIPYYGWVASARAGMLDNEVKKADIVIEDAGDRRLELKQFAVAKGCGGASAEVVGSPTPLPAILPSIAAPQPPAAPAPLHRDGSVPRQASSVGEISAPKPSATRPPDLQRVASAAPTRRASPSETVPPSGGTSVILPLGPGADVDRAAAEITAALQQH
jgi:hypothetical protein